MTCPPPTRLLQPRPEAYLAYDAARQVVPLPTLDLLSREPLQQLLRDFTGERRGYVRVTEKGYLLPSRYAEEGRHHLNFKPRSDDTWIVSFPRSGSTVTQEMVWLLANDLDFNTAREKRNTDRILFFESSIIINSANLQDWNAEYDGDADLEGKLRGLSTRAIDKLDRLERAPGPRFIRTHLPFSLLPPDLLTCGAKVIYVARNPKDVAVSFYHQNRLLRLYGYTGDFPTYWDYFQNDLILWSPYWSHVEEGWQSRFNSNVLFLFYEDINKDLQASIRNVGKFLKKQLTEEEVNALAEYLHISNFRKNESVNLEAEREWGLLRSNEASFIREGKSGGWRKYFSPEMQTQANKWIAENLAKTDMRFPNV